MNLYWSVYKNLERELINLADVIHFDDNQAKVYSIHIADLLIRTAVEIESISKHLYEIDGGNMYLTDNQGKCRSLYFDSDCIQALDLKWHITKKVVNVVSSNFYFSTPEYLILRPLRNCNKQSEGRWKKAYQAVKHDRVGSLSAGNIGNLVKAMAALYLLNIYNMDNLVCDVEIGATEVDTSLGSAVFSVNAYKATMLRMSEHVDDSCICVSNNIDPDRTLDTAVLIDKYTDESFRELHKNYIADLEITNRNFANSEEIRTFLQKHPEYKEKSLSQICIACGEEIETVRLGKSDQEEDKEKIRNAGMEMLASILCFSNTNKGKKNKRELILNKLQPIYPVL